MMAVQAAPNTSGNNAVGKSQYQLEHGGLRIPLSQHYTASIPAKGW